MTSGGIVRLSIDHLGDLMALEQAAFLPIDRQSPRSLRYLLSRAHADVWGMVREGRLVAAVIVLYRCGSRVARLYSIATDQAARQHGLARQLLAHAEQRARRKGCNCMRAEVRQKNLPSRQLFEKAGYRGTGSMPAYYTDGMDALRYEKSLIGAPHG